MRTKTYIAIAFVFGMLVGGASMGLISRRATPPEPVPMPVAVKTPSTESDLISRMVEYGQGELSQGEKLGLAKGLESFLRDEIPMSSVSHGLNMGNWKFYRDQAMVMDVSQNQKLGAYRLYAHIVANDLPEAARPSKETVRDLRQRALKTELIYWRDWYQSWIPGTYKWEDFWKDSKFGPTETNIHAVAFLSGITPEEAGLTKEEAAMLKTLAAKYQ